MKKLKKLAALILSIVMVMGLAVSARADTTAGVQTKAKDSPSSDSATITITNAYKGVEYKVYKLFGASLNSAYDSIVYTGDTIPKGTGTVGDETISYDFTLFFHRNDSGNIIPYTVDRDSEGNEVTQPTDSTVYSQRSAYEEPGSSTVASAALIQEMEKYVKVATPVVSAVSDGSSTLKFTGLDYGYYIVSTSQTDTSNIILTSTNPNAKIVDKATTTPTEKNPNTVFKSVGEYQTNVQIGDTVDFTINFMTVNYAKDSDDVLKAVTQYAVEDVPTDLDIIWSTLKVKVSDSEAKDAQGTKTGFIQLTQDSGNYSYTLTEGTKGKLITIPWSTETDGKYNIKYENGAVVTITYQAKVTGTAAASGTANNKAYITYKVADDNTDKKINGTDKPEGDVTLYTESFTLTKVDQNNSPLSNAEFKLQRKSTTTDSEGKVVDVWNDVPVVAETNTDGTVTGYHIADNTSESRENTKIVAGTVTIKGLDVDSNVEYRLVETKAPAGYNILKNPITLSTSSNKYYVTSKNNDVTLGTGFPTETADTSNAVENNATTFLNQRVVNSTGSKLPETGGTGTTVFYVVGGVLVLAALVVLITRKRVHMDD
jgi:LPXTG-motif cell wall-anchored protein